MSMYQKWKSLVFQLSKSNLAYQTSYIKAYIVYRSTIQVKILAALFTKLWSLIIRTQTCTIVPELEDIFKKCVEKMNVKKKKKKTLCNWGHVKGVFIMCPRSVRKSRCQYDGPNMPDMVWF